MNKLKYFNYTLRAILFTVGSLVVLFLINNGYEIASVHVMLTGLISVCAVGYITLTILK